MLTARGLEFIKQHEGTVRASDGQHRAYNDAGGNATIGYGHLLHKGRLTSLEESMRINEAAAEQYLRADVQAASAAVNTAVMAPLTNYQRDALISWFFNLGLSHETFTSNLIKLINSPIFWEALSEGRIWPKAAIREEFSKWSYSNGRLLPGLLIRRQNEAELFLNGSYNDGQ